LATREQSFDYFIILLGLAEIANAPRDPESLAEILVNEAVTVKAPSWAEAAKGARNIVAGAAAQDVQLFYIGKHSRFTDKKPQGKNKEFFRKLEEHYVSMLEP